MNKLSIFYHYHIVWNFNKYIRFPIVGFYYVVQATIKYKFIWNIKKYITQQSTMLEFWKKDKVILGKSEFNTGRFNPTLADVISNRARKRFFIKKL